VWKLVPHNRGRKEADNVRGQSSEEDSSVKEAVMNRRLQKITRIDA
jgi:hypothetical protein